MRQVCVCQQSQGRNESVENSSKRGKKHLWRCTQLFSENPSTRVCICVCIIISGCDFPNAYCTCRTRQDRARTLLWQNPKFISNRIHIFFPLFAPGNSVCGPCEHLTSNSGENNAATIFRLIFSAGCNILSIARWEATHVNRRRVGGMGAGSLSSGSREMTSKL